MAARPSRIPAPDKVDRADPEPVAVEFLVSELPEHVRAFLAEQQSGPTSQD